MKNLILFKEIIMQNMEISGKFTEKWKNMGRKKYYLLVGRGMVWDICWNNPGRKAAGW